MEIVIIRGCGEEIIAKEYFDMTPNEGLKNFIEEVNIELGDDIKIREYGD